MCPRGNLRYKIRDRGYKHKKEQCKTTWVGCRYPKVRLRKSPKHSIISTTITTRHPSPPCYPGPTCHTSHHATMSSLPPVNTRTTSHNTQKNTGRRTRPGRTKLYNGKNTQPTLSYYNICLTLRYSCLVDLDRQSASVWSTVATGGLLPPGTPKVCVFIL